VANASALLNEGMIFRPGSVQATHPNDAKTFIISGLGRGGTTMVASVLLAAGVPLGDRLFEAALEDRDMTYALRGHDTALLDALIADRNGRYGNWGFKIPYIHGLLRYADIGRFRNPHLVLVFRDPVAITSRVGISDYQDPLAALPGTAASTQSLVNFVMHTDCPCLLVSYEKAVITPESFVDTLIAYCGLPPDEATRAQMLRQVMPNSPDYAIGTTVKIAGRLEALRGTTLCGWCAYANIMDTIELDLFVNAGRMRTFRADQFRPDLLAAGFGNGEHGFMVDVADIALAETDVLHVRINGRGLYELDNSGLSVAAYRKLG
jgi:hypothetical protein